jgi:hypothetical protein
MNEDELCFFNIHRNFSYPFGVAAFLFLQENNQGISSGNPLPYSYNTNPYFSHDESNYNAHDRG